MGEIKAGVVVVTEFCRPNDNKFQGYIDYINRSNAVRNKNTAKYNLYQDYMGNPDKTSGLFTSDKDILTEAEKNNLKNVFEQAQENQSLMWQTVISFDNRWLKQNGIVNEDGTSVDEAKLKEVTRGGIRRMLEAEGLENAVWSGAIHFNTDNLHIHIATVEPVPMREQKDYVQYNYRYENGKRIKEPVLDDEGKPITKKEYKGRFKQKSIERCKSHVINELVNDKENNIKINNIIRESITNQKKEHPLMQDEEFISKFENLYNMMPECNKNMWNYNNPVMAKLRPIIDDISLTYINKYHSEEFKELQERINTQEEIYKQAYGDSKKDYSKNKMKDLYTRLGNAVLKEIKNYDSELAKAEKTLGNINDYYSENEKIINEDINEHLDEEDNIEDEYEEDFIEPEVEVEDSYYEWSSNFKRAKKLIHQKKPDYETAAMLLMEEHNEGNVLATYELGDMYRYGRGKRISSKLAQQYYQRAFRGFEVQIKACRENDKKGEYINYRLGKMYYYGQGVEQSYENAGNKFKESGNEFSTYMLAKMKYYGQGMDKELEGAFEDFVSISDNNGYASYKAASMIENGETENKKYDKEELYDNAFVKFMDMEMKNEDDNLEYRIGMMYLNGKGTDSSEDKAISFLEKSAEAKNVYAMNKLAQIYLQNKVEEKIPDAVSYLESAAKDGKSDIAMYTLGNIFSSREYGMMDMEEAKKWYEMAEKNGNEFAAYKLGNLELKSDNLEKAVGHFLKCNNKFAWYSLGKIYLNEQSEMFQPDKGIEYMEKAAGQGNIFAQYKIGKEYHEGNIVERNDERAIYWLNKAAGQDNKYASYILGKIYYERQDYKNAELQFGQCNSEKIKPYADYYMGKMYLDKQGPLYNPEKGIECLEQSANEGNTTAAFVLGITYLKGETVTENKTLGKAWIEKAANEGNEFAGQFLDKLNNGTYKRNAPILRKAKAMILCNASQFLKKALKEEWQKKQNEKEHERIVEEGMEVE